MEITLMGEAGNEVAIARFKTISETVAVNRPLILDKITKAITAGSLIKEVETEEQDKYANDWLAKCTATLPVIEGLRKEYTGLMDEWKKNEMADENKLKALMLEVRTKRNERANRIAAKAAEDKAAIERQKVKEIEIARIKNAQVKSMTIGIATRITQGDAAIAKIFDGMTLANIDIEIKKLDFTPKLKEDIFNSFLIVSYDKSLISEQEFAEIVEKASKHFDYNKCDKTYCSDVTAIVKTWKDKIPAKRKALQTLTDAVGVEAEALKKKTEEDQAKEAADRAEALQSLTKAAEDTADIALASDKLDAEFKSQIAVQDIAVQDGTRSSAYYRLKDESPIKVAETLSRAMITVFADPNFKGIHKRDKAGIPKRDDLGNTEYIDAIQSWLDLLAKIKPSPQFDGVVLSESISTVAKSK